MKVSITIYAKVDILSSAKKQILHRGIEVVFDHAVDSVARCKDKATFAAYVEEQIRKAGKAKFIEILKSDTAVKRSVGGTKWEVEVRPPYRFFASMQGYQESLDQGFLNKPANVDIEIEFMRHMVLDTFLGRNEQDEYFSDFLNNL